MQVPELSVLYAGQESTHKPLNILYPELQVVQTVLDEQVSQFKGHISHLFVPDNVFEGQEAWQLYIFLIKDSLIKIFYFIFTHAGKIYQSQNKCTRHSQVILKDMLDINLRLDHCRLDMNNHIYQ